MPKPSPSVRAGTPLTDREREILTLLAAGIAAPEVARRLGISPVTLGGHLTNARIRLGARTTTELVARYLASAIADGEVAAWPPIRPLRRP